MIGARALSVLRSAREASVGGDRICLRRLLRACVAATAFASILAGCSGISTEGERRAARELASVGETYRPEGRRPALPVLGAEAPLRDFLLFALLNQPRVEAAYFDWVAAVRRITLARSLPDPMLNFESDVSDMVMSLVPGLMQELPGPGKLKWAGNVATAESDARYFAFEAAILEIAYRLKQAYYELHFLDAKLKVNREMFGIVGEIERLARVQSEVGKVTLQDVLRAQIERDRIETEIANLEDSRNPLLAQFKAALGLRPEEAAPPVPVHFESTSPALTSEALVVEALERNPRLKALEAEVRGADASIRLAYKARLPDFRVGVDVDVEAAPAIVTPQLRMTIPLWRDKIAAQLEAAQAEKRARESRLSEEQILLAVDFAEKAFLYRESSRDLELLTDRLLPKAEQSLQVAESGYVSGKVDFLSLLDAQRTLLSFRLSEIEARVQRELSLAGISLLILGIPPAGAPASPSPAALDTGKGGGS